MTQHQLIPDGPRCVGLIIEVDDLTSLELDDAIQLTVRLKWADGLSATCYSQRWSGVMVDYLDTFVDKVVHTYLYSSAASVPNQATAVTRAARRHKARHDRVG